MDIVLRHSKITLKFQEAKPINYLNVELLTKSLQLWFLILVLLIRCFVQFGGLHYLTHRIQIISSLEGSSKNPGPWLRTSALQYLQYLRRPVNTTTCKQCISLQVRLGWSVSNSPPVLLMVIMSNFSFKMNNPSCFNSDSKCTHFKAKYFFIYIFVCIFFLPHHFRQWTTALCHYLGISLSYTI